MACEWKNKIVLITGAAGGIGSNVVRKALQEGAQHIVILDVDEKTGVSLQDELNAKHGPNKVKFVKCDITDDSQLRANLDAVLSDKSREYVVVNNAGILNDSMQTFNKQIQVNVTALITSSLRALELMRADTGGRGGTIINISSIAAISLVPHTPVYSATKSAVLMFSMGIGADDYYSRTKVRVLTMCFGATNTGLIAVGNMASFDDKMTRGLTEVLTQFPSQSPQSAAQAVIDMFKRGASASVWLSNADKPALEITDVIRKAYDDMMVPVFQ